MVLPVARLRAKGPSRHQFAAAKVRRSSIQAGNHIGFCPFPTDFGDAR